LNDVKGTLPMIEVFQVAFKPQKNIAMKIHLVGDQVDFLLEKMV
jgi:hypothetical protein